MEVRAHRGAHLEDEQSYRGVCQPAALQKSAPTRDSRMRMNRLRAACFDFEFALLHLPFFMRERAGLACRVNYLLHVELTTSLPPVRGRKAQGRSAF